MLITLLIFAILTFLTSIFALLKASNGSIFKDLQESSEQNQEKIREIIDKNFSKNREENLTYARNSREEINNLFSSLTKSQGQKLEDFARQLHLFEEKFSKNSLQNREELSKSLKEFDQSQAQKFEEFFAKNEKTRLEIEQKLDLIRTTVENKLTYLQENNAKKLEEMRLVVDEKLQATVEKRFNQSFELISNRLEQVQKGLGEMQNLAVGVGDLKKVLSNVKTRGNIGEIQLGAILEQFFSPAQYEQNCATKPQSSQRVEYAIKIPSKDSDSEFIYLPIDSKFPIEDFHRLNEIYEGVDATNQQHTKAAIEQARRQFEASVKKAAKDIQDKYLNPPHTTDFGIMFVPTEGLYAEILRNNSLFDELQKKFRVVVLGPTNIVAFLSALQMGFRTLAVEKSSSEVWKTLGLVKTEFSKFGDLLEKAKKKMQEATNHIEATSTRSRAIERQLKNVETKAIDETKTLDLIEDILEIDDE